MKGDACLVCHSTGQDGQHSPSELPCFPSVFLGIMRNRVSRAGRCLHCSEAVPFSKRAFSIVGAGGGGAHAAPWDIPGGGGKDVVRRSSKSRIPSMDEIPSSMDGIIQSMDGIWAQIPSMDGIQKSDSARPSSMDGID